MRPLDNKQRHLVVIAGPTAAGKSRVALELASHYPAAIVCADARQAVRGMHIGTAAPTEEEVRRAPHYGFAVREPEEEYSAADYATYTRELIDELPLGMLPLIVGGSGLYIQALIDGFSSDVVPTPPEIRLRVQQMLDEVGRVEFYNQLQSIDPIAAERYADMNPRRIQRALEYYYTTGSTLSSTWNTPRRTSPYTATWIAIDQDDDVLRRQITQRCEQMWNDGLVDETQALLARGIDPSAHILRTIGYAEAIEVIQGRCSQADAQERLIRATWQYAKRQRTWFRRDERYTWLRGPIESIIPRIREAICADAPRWCS